MAAAIWPLSRTQIFDLSDDPAVGAMLRFYNENTSTPQVVYQDAALSTPHDQPIEADARGRFPIVYLNTTPGSYRQRVTDADGVEIFDDDGIAVAQLATYVPPDAGETSPSLLFTTGMRIGYYGTSAPEGWVRAAGRTIGNASSGATERANDDCEDLFAHLWNADANLSVSGGRGANAAADWAANKTITLPDYRERSAAGLATMGNSDAGLVDDAYVTAGTNTSTLGAKAGVDDVTLSSAQIPAHNHTASFTGDALPTHTHDVTGTSVDSASGGTLKVSNGGSSFTASNAAQAKSAGTPSGSVTVNNSTGGGGAHNNMPPTIYELVIIKL